MELRKTSAVLRASIYEDVRELLHPGFLTHRVTVNKCPMSMRTLTEDDLFLIRHRAGENYGKDWQYWIIATSIWMIEGQVVFADPGMQYTVYDRIKSLPRMFREDLFSVFAALMSRSRTAVERLSGFLYEDESRYLWTTEGKRMFDRPPFQGAPVLGLNAVQKTWVAYNKYEDKRLERKYWWGLSKFMVQPHAPKGIQKLTSSEQKDDEREEHRRHRVMDLEYWKAQGVKIGDESKARILKSHTGVTKAETEEDLNQEMADWVSGKKDFHDNAVDFVKAKIKGEVEGRRVDEETRIASIQHALEEEGIDEPAFAPLMGEAAEAVKRRMVSKRVATVVYDDKHNSAYDKYIKNNPDVGVLGVDEHGNIRSSAEVTQNAQELLGLLVKPDEDKNQTGELDAQVRGRASQQRGKG
jgi:hypothetical protein